MRHRKSFNHLGRTAGHRRAMLANMASSLLIHKRIKTTTAKAKALRVYIEPLITKSKSLSSVTEKTHAQRVVFSYLQDKVAVHELFTEVAPKIETRPGGYTRIIKLGNRLGDNADMCIIELVDFNELMLSAKDDSQKASGKRKRRRGGSGTGKATDEKKAVAKKDQAEETEVVEAKSDSEETTPEESKKEDSGTEEPDKKEE
jgi:large subunit ribosomal protein L17